MSRYHENREIIYMNLSSIVLLAMEGGEIMKKPLSKKAQLKEADFWGKIKKRTDDPGKTCLK